MKQLTTEEFKQVCDYYEFDLDQGNIKTSLEHYEDDYLEYYWDHFNLRVHCEHHFSGKEVINITSMYFVDGDGEKFKIPSLIFKSIAYYITEWSNA